MRSALPTLLLTLLCCSSLVEGALARPKKGLTKREEPTLVVHNRVLARVNGRTITVMDVVKEMEPTFQSAFPQYAGVDGARYEFFKAQWRHFLDELVNRELILADAKEAKSEISRSEIRGEVRKQFGPDIAVNLDKQGISRQEAEERAEEAIRARRILGLRAHAPAQNRITPQALREAYQEWKEENIKPAEWTYRMVTIKGPDITKSAAISRELYLDLVRAGTNPKAMAVAVEQADQQEPRYSVTLSENKVVSDVEISDTYRQQLEKLSTGDWSPPFKKSFRKSRREDIKILQLVQRKEPYTPPMNEVVQELEERLTMQAVQEEVEKYLTMLRRRYGVTYQLAEISDDYQPFSLK